MENVSRLSSMQKGIFGLVALALLAGGYLYSQRTAPSNGGAIACTEEAKLCPDGVTYVGRTGPKCEFAACPSLPATGTVTVTAGLNEPTVGLGFSVTPLEVAQDSRCPADVQCIQAGTVQLKAVLGGDLGAYTATLELGKPLVNEQYSITLVSVSPQKISTQQISPDKYAFTFKIEKKN